MATDLCDRCTIRDVCDVKDIVAPPPQCRNFVQRSMTHFDQLRAMSVDEMAKFLDFVRSNKDYPLYYTDWLDWLKAACKVSTMEAET